MRSGFALLLFLAGVSVLMLLGLHSLERAPQYRSAQFDSARAWQDLRRLNPEQQAHPVGSAHNRLIAQRIITAMRAIGYAPTIQRQLQCSELGHGCSLVENIVAVREGRNRDAILVTAHYDSVAAGPGAGDDMSGVAILIETARRMARQPNHNAIIFLFTDAEEAGLRGAMAFAAHHPAMARVRLVINAEARGVSGPSTMFETSSDNRALIAVLARTLTRPVANSLLYDVYRHMPNNTDVTIYKRADILAYNFAFSRGAALYHSARDDDRHLSRDSMAQQGDNIARLLQAVADVPLASLRSSGDASYFDIFGYVLVYWPTIANLGIALVITLSILWLGYGAGHLRPRATAKIWLVALGGLAMLILLGWLLSLPLGTWPGVHPLDHPQPWAGRIALLTAGLACCLLTGWFAQRRTTWQAVMWAVSLLQVLLAMLLAVVLPGAAFVFLVPSLCFTLCALVERLCRREPLLAPYLAFVPIAYFALYLFLASDAVLGFQLAWAKLPILFLMLLPAMPIAARHLREWRAAWPPLTLLGLVGLIATAVGAATPPYDPDHPRSVNIDYVQSIIDGSRRRSQWRIDSFGPADAVFAERAGFAVASQQYRRWGAYAAQAQFARAPDLRLAGPNWRVIAERREADGSRVIEGEIAAGRGGFIFGMAFAPHSSAQSLEVAGTRIIDAKAFASARGVAATMSGMGDMPLRFLLRTKSADPLPVTLFELSAVPANAQWQAIRAMRPANAAPIHFGDHAETQIHVRL
ncbi:MAG: M28 family peptidase [Sphingomonadaceae bacterium]|nr:M28 family peptidase [Sphingomonadaceae bacterium]